MKKNAVALIALAALFTFGAAAGTFAYFTHEAIFENIFQTKPYSAEAYEEFTPPDDWTPGVTTDKKIYAKNTGEGDVMVRVKFESETWFSADGTELSLKIGGDDVAIKNFDNPNDWIISADGYYYYQSVLAPGQTTKAFLGSVKFNPITPNDSVAVDANDKAYGDPGYDTSAWVSKDGKIEYIGWKDADGKLHKAYRSSGKGYDGATYTLKVKIEILQADKAAFAGVWGAVPPGTPDTDGAFKLYEKLAK